MKFFMITANSIAFAAIMVLLHSALMWLAFKWLHCLKCQILDNYRGWQVIFFHYIILGKVLGTKTLFL